MEGKVADPIEQFLARYTREYDYYERVAGLCARRCEQALEQNAVRAIVTFRAKRPERLRPKIQNRHESKPYATAEDIYADIVDLAGIRIALYFPGDVPKVDDLISHEFDVKLKKRFPDSAVQRDPTKRFSGYLATHYRVHMKPDALASGNERFAGCMIEIQVASVLMHAWAEVEHDLAYKPHSGSLSLEERSILDGLNGLVLSGELSLGLLQEAVRGRVAQQNRSFVNQYELAAHIYNIYKSALGDSEDLKEVHVPEAEAPMGRADQLLLFLRKIVMDRPELLSAGLAAWAPDLRDRYTIVEQIMRYLVRGSSTRQEAYDLVTASLPDSPEK